MNEPEISKLLAAAAESLKNAYSPYSGYSVGVALLGVDGRLFGGCNVENASYGLTICAERSAVSAAVAAGCREFSAVAVVAGGDEMPYPCGACRQVLSEFCSGELKVYTACSSSIGDYEEMTLGELLPKSFGLNK